MNWCVGLNLLERVMSSQRTARQTVRTGFCSLTVGITVILGPVVRPQTPQFRTDVQYVEIPVVVVDQLGAFLTDITERDLDVFEDGMRQEISVFRLVTVPPPKTGSLSSSVEKSAGSPMTVDDLHRIEGRIYAM